MSYLRYMCLFAYSGVQHILCCRVFVLFSSSCVTYVVSFSGLSILIVTSVFAIVYCTIEKKMQMHWHLVYSISLFHLHN
jgi:hypothetical protein